MRRRKHEFSAMMVLEVGKSWMEADADTAEAIDFLEYYARQALRIFDSSDLLAPSPPEQLDSLYYIPLGVGAVIPPWNFPCAIVTGMVGACAGRRATRLCSSPPSKAPGSPTRCASCSGIRASRAGCSISSPGRAKWSARGWSNIQQTRFITFTGSKAVGVGIYEQAAKVQPGQKWLKRAILEMGGKDAVVVDETADLESAAQGIVASAFGFQGQKCSAGSRAIIVDGVYDRVAGRVVELASELTVGATDKGADSRSGAGDRHRRHAARSWTTSRSARRKASCCSAARRSIRRRVAISSRRRSSATCRAMRASPPKKFLARC